MRGAEILLVIEIRGEKIHVECLNVAAPGSGHHCLESTVALAVALERKDLMSRDSGGEKTKA
jgi:hypothetical protein